MRKYLAVGFFLASCLLLPVSSYAQFTTVTATVTDPNNIPYAGAVMNAVLVPSVGGGYTLNGQPYSGRIGPVTLDSSGKFTVNFGDVTLITPGSPQWQITISSASATIGLPLGTGPQQFTFTSSGTTISGSSPVSLTTALNALAPKLTNFASGGSGTISCSISAAVLFETAANTAGCATGFTFSTPNLTIPVNGSYNIGTTPMLSTPPSGGTPGNNISVGGPSNMGAITNTAVNNLAVGSFALNTLTTGQADTAVGIGSMATSGTAATSDTAVGHNTMPNVTANLNTAVGDGTLALLVSGADNTAVGAGAGGNTTGASNTLVGFQAGLNLTSGGSNVIIGLSTGSVTSGSSNVVICVTNCTSGITATSNNQLDILDAIIGTGMGTPATSTTEFKGNLKVDGTCTGCSGAIAIPATVSGATSGGFPCFDSATDMNTTAAIGAGVLLKGGGAGACGSASSITDNGTTVTNTEPVIVPANTNSALRFSNAATTGFSSFGAGIIYVQLSNANEIAYNPNTNTGEITTGATGLFDFTSVVDNGTGAADTGISRSAAGVVAIGNGAQGNVTGTIKPGKYATGTTCAAAGTAANPSVASCGSSAAGLFSCATNASTGTCQVNTTAVTANSSISITQDAADGTPLSVTCNTGNVLSATAPVLASKSAGTSFTINLGTVATNPACFEYIIVN